MKPLHVWVLSLCVDQILGRKDAASQQAWRMICIDCVVGMSSVLWCVIYVFVSQAGAPQFDGVSLCVVLCRVYVCRGWVQLLLPPLALTFFTHSRRYSFCFPPVCLLSQQGMGNKTGRILAGERRTESRRGGLD